MPELYNLKTKLNPLPEDYEEIDEETFIALSDTTKPGGPNREKRKQIRWNRTFRDLNSRQRTSERGWSGSAEPCPRQPAWASHKSSILCKISFLNIRSVALKASLSVRLSAFVCTWLVVYAQRKTPTPVF